MTVGSFLLSSFTLLTGFLIASAAPEESRYPKTLESLRFRSVEKFQTGALPTGPVFGHRTLDFRDGKFTYIPSDGIETGDYKWNPMTGKVEGTSLSGKIYKGQYDHRTKTLTWDGAKYKVQEPEKPKDKK